MTLPLVPGFEEVRFGSVVSHELLVALARNELFHGVEGSIVRDYATAFRVTRLPPGTLLHGGNRHSTCVFLILDGGVQIENQRVGRNAVVEVLRGGQFTGEASLLGLARFHRVTARCVEPTLLCWARAVDLTAPLNRDPQMALNVARSLHARLMNAVAALDELPDYVDKP